MNESPIQTERSEPQKLKEGNIDHQEVVEVIRKSQVEMEMKCYKVRYALMNAKLNLPHL
jgi:hypothetical protein